MKKRTLFLTVRLRVLGLLSLSLLFLPWEANSQARETSLEELTRTSTIVVLGKATGMESFWNEEQTRIITEVTIQVEEHVKGEGEAETKITVPGGRIGNTLYEVSDMPVFVEGEQILVFLWRHPSGRQLVTAGTQGKLSVVEDRQRGERVVVGISRLFQQEAGKTDGSAPSRVRIPLEEVTQAVKRISNE